MKRIIQSFALLLVLTALLLGIGLVIPVVHYDTEIVIDASIDQVWQFYQDEDKLVEWMEGCHRVELLEGEKGMVNSQCQISRKFENGGDLRTRTILAKKELDYIHYRFHDSTMEHEQNVFFSEIEGKTKIKSISEIKSKHLVLHSVFVIGEFFEKIFTTREVKSMNNLKRMIESS